jgi:Uma2 family endonuclease
MATDTATRMNLEPVLGLKHRLRLRLDAPVSDELFASLAAANPDLRLERTARGELIVMAPAGFGSSQRNFGLTYQLARWTQTKGKTLGIGADCSAAFRLPNGATKGPDASWIAIDRWNALPPEQREPFPAICPDFVAEIRSDSDRLPDLRKKMKEYLANGARLGWLIDPLRRTVEIYRPGKEAETLKRPKTLSGEDVLPGFVLDLKDILA